MKVNNGKVYILYCDKCKRYCGGFYGLENEKEAKEFLQVKEVDGEDVCWKCK